MYIDKEDFERLIDDVRSVASGQPFKRDVVIWNQRLNNTHKSGNHLSVVFVPRDPVNTSYFEVFLPGDTLNPSVRLFKVYSPYGLNAVHVEDYQCRCLRVFSESDNLVKMIMILYQEEIRKFVNSVAAARDKFIQAIKTSELVECIEAGNVSKY